MSDDEYEPTYEPENVNVGDSIVLRVPSLVPPPLEYMASLHSQNREISGRQVWTGSLALAHSLLHLSNEEKHELFTGKRILELGSGTGVLGMSIAKICSPQYSPACLVLTDGDETAIDLLRSSLSDEFNEMDTQVVKTCPLIWGTDCHCAVACSFLQWCRAAFTVWSESEHILFDCIVAGDVLYKDDLPALFFDTVHSLIRKDGRGTLWLCHVPRHGVTQENVVEAAQAAGFLVERLDTPAIAQGCPPDDLKRAVIYRMSPRC